MRTFRKILHSLQFPTHLHGELQKLELFSLTEIIENSFELIFAAIV